MEQEIFFSKSSSGTDGIFNHVVLSKKINYYTPVPRVQWVHLTVPSSVGTEVANIHWWGAGLRSPYLTMVIMWTT